MSRRVKAKAPVQVPAVQPEATPVKVDVVLSASPDMKAIGGGEADVWNYDLLRRTMGTAWWKGGEDPKATDNVAVTAMALRAFAPADPVEAMIAAQAVALHFASLECARRAMLPQQPADASSKLRRDAANTARAMVEMTEALQRRRGKGPQVVRVERVIVNEGGQAIVGHVAAPGSLPASGGVSPLAIDQGAAPMSLVEAVAFPAHRGEGSE